MNNTKEVFIVAAKRTPIGGLMGSLSHLSATELGALAIRGAIESIDLNPETVDEVIIGNVLSANLGQSPARQAAIGAGIPTKADATTINKVCASGMKATAFGAQQIELGLSDIVVTGGMESMSNTPHYSYIRSATKFGHTTLVDGMLKDGLWDPYNDFHMGSAAEMAVRKYNISREAQDDYALASYNKAVAATKAGKFTREVVPVTVKQKAGDSTITEDEDVYKVIPEKVAKLAPAFEKDGTITAANASNLNDAAAAIILASREAVEKYGFKPLAKIVAYADAAQDPEWFTTAPSLAIPKALEHANLSLKDIDLFEINEAYAAVVLANAQILGLDTARINVYGGGVSMGHPIGASGARIITTLISALKQEGGKFGVAAICNGGGGASAIVIENI
jgi:acetyl-CoA C-acetyltransferase